MKEFIIRKNRIICLFAIVAIVIFFYCGITPANTAYAQSNEKDEIRYGLVTYSQQVQTAGVIQEVINYSWNETVIGYANDYFPEYYNTNNNLNNPCAPVAGSMIIGFYDRYYTELIPNFTPGRNIGSYYRYNPMTINTGYIQGVMDSLYVSMSTNNPLPGTTQTQYKTGITSYVNVKGKSITYISIMNSGNINYNSGSNSLVSQISNGRCISLFVCDFNLAGVSDNGSSVTISKVTYSGNHIMIAYGYMRIKYYDNNNNNFRTDLFLKVSSGFYAPLNGWYYVGSSETTLVDAEAAYIY